mgnify:CR=1 FL=1
MNPRIRAKVKPKPKQIHGLLPVVIFKPLLNYKNNQDGRQNGMNLRHHNECLIIYLSQRTPQTRQINISGLVSLVKYIWRLYSTKHNYFIAKSDRRTTQLSRFSNLTKMLSLSIPPGTLA